MFTTPAAPQGDSLTGHQGFFTDEAMTQIAEVTLGNLDAVRRGEPCDNELTGKMDGQ